MGNPSGAYSIPYHKVLTMKVNLEQEKASLKKCLEERYPAGVPRCRISEATGGIVSAKTLANLASGQGGGPRGAYRIRGRVVYTAEALVDWLFMGEGKDGD